MVEDARAGKPPAVMRGIDSAIGRRLLDSAILIGLRLALGEDRKKALRFIVDTDTE
jgi:hypothetical protein